MSEEWIGRKVRRTDTDDDDVLGPAIVLAVDDTAYAPSAWIKYPPKADGGRAEYPSYRSVDLSDLEDIETGDCGPRWGTLGALVAVDTPGATPSKERNDGR